jgi:hypothetical protein
VLHDGLYFVPFMYYSAMIRLPAQPAEEDAFEMLGIKAISLGVPVLSCHGNARWVDDVFAPYNPVANGMYLIGPALG